MGQVRTKEFTYQVELDERGVMLADGEGAIDAPKAWKPDHFLVAALLACTLESLRYHAERAGLEASGRGEGRALVTKREADERYAVVEIGVSCEIALEPDPGDEGTAELLFKAERDCFVGASLTVAPEYRWNVNGRAVSARAAPS
jgi:organic hydroperoxide reductase OsmC/OhrA